MNQVKEIIESATPPMETLQEALARLAALEPLEYDQCRKDEAKKLNVRVDTLDKEVAKVRKPVTQENYDEKFPTEAPWDEPVSTAELLDEINSLIKKFIICAPETTTAATLWIAFTWIICSATRRKFPVMHGVITHES